MEESSRRFREDVGAGHRVVHHQIAQHIKINVEETAKSKSRKQPNQTRTLRRQWVPYSMPRSWNWKKEPKLDRNQYWKLQKVKAKPMFPFSPYTQTFCSKPKAQRHWDQSLYVEDSSLQRHVPSIWLTWVHRNKAPLEPRVVQES